MVNSFDSHISAKFNYNKMYDNMSNIGYLLLIICEYIDFLYNVLLGSKFILIVKLEMRRLILRQEIVVDNYIIRGEELFKRHKMVEKLSELEEKELKQLEN